MVEKLKRLFAHPRLPLMAAVLGVVLTLPALGAGFFADDFTHRLAFRPDFRALGGIRGDWDIFRFQDADRAHLQRMMDIGITPWWTAPSLRLAFFRPLTSLWHAFDYRLIVGMPVVMHAENLLLYGGIVFLAALLYRRLSAPPWVAGLAAVLYAVDDAHALPATWIAMRGALLSTLFGFAAILAHDRARRRRGARWVAVGPALYGVGLLSGEATLGTLGYLAAHALFVDETPSRERARALAPYAAVTLAWIALYKALGYGTVGSGMYYDPGKEPLAFLSAVATRLPVLLSAQLAGPPSDLAMSMTEPAFRGLVAFSVLGLSLGFVVMARVLGKDRRAAFFATGLVLSLVPSCGTLPNDRLLLFSGLGAFGLVARFLERVGQVPRRHWERALAGVLVFAHGIVAPIALPIRSIVITRLYGGYIGRADATLPHVGSDGTLVVVNAPDLLVVGYAEFARAVRGLPLPPRTRLLASAVDANGGTVARLDDRTLEMTLRDGFAGDPIAQLTRGSTVPFFRGEVAEVEGMTAEVLDLTPDNRPKKVRFQFDRSLEDPSLTWIVWEGNGFVHTVPPRVGEEAEVKGIDFTRALLGY